MRKSNIKKHKANAQKLANYLASRSNIETLNIDGYIIQGVDVARLMKFNVYVGEYSTAFSFDENFSEAEARSILLYEQMYKNEGRVLKFNNVTQIIADHKLSVQEKSDFIKEFQELN